MSRLPILLAAFVIAGAGGTMAGTTAVGGMTQLARGAEPPALGAERDTLAWVRDEAAAWPAADEAAVRLAALPAAEPSLPCTDCSDFDVGHRWAETHTQDDAEQCAADASAFADGCAAYLADRERRAVDG